MNLIIWILLSSVCLGVYCMPAPSPSPSPQFPFTVLPPPGKGHRKNAARFQQKPRSKI